VRRFKVADKHGRDTLALLDKLERNLAHLGRALRVATARRANNAAKGMLGFLAAALFGKKHLARSGQHVFYL